MTDFGTKEDLENEVWFPTQAGDLLVHHALTIHRADSNQSQNRTRKAMGLIYYANKAQEDKEYKEEYQAKLAEEIQEKAAKMSIS